MSSRKANLIQKFLSKAKPVPDDVRVNARQAAFTRRFIEEVEDRFFAMAREGRGVVEQGR